MMRRTGFRRKTIERTRTVHKPLPEHLRRNVSLGRVATVVTASCLKTEAQRSPALLRLAQGRGCLLRLAGVCNHNPATVVAAHSNDSAHGKGLARKAHDHFSVWACHACHAWLDQGEAEREHKRAAFDAGLVRQLSAWAAIAQDAGEPERNRRAARWALERHP